MNINKVVIAGRLGADPELKTTPNGTYVASFSIATNKVWKDKNTGEKKENTEWVSCTAWGRTAETIGKYFAKGKEIYVEGRLQTRSWEHEGRKYYKTEVVVDSLQFVGSSKQESTGSAQSQPSLPNDDEEINPEDIPF